MRIALGIEYCGQAFYGWQIQPDGSRTIQGCVEAALSQVANHPVSTVCAGRTDRGVHATAQVIHADVQAQRTERAWIFGGNTHLPSDINILWAQTVDANFHARFRAQARHYRYVIINRLTRSALNAGRATWFHAPLDIEKMQIAGNYLLGTHDFTAYRAIGCQAKSPIRHLFKLTLKQQGEKITLDIGANAFLHHMVRNIAGVLMTIGCGKRSPEWAAEILASRDRKQGGVTAPASGLYLTQVDYPAEYTFPLNKLDI